ncbi:MAG: hypothetical protein A3J38_02855 [Gammaproteobacteria bacterium RIFCSPHIGHO2_12_FULL_45_9]|nr:MAG: hypothetical protein A3J38_02855 [Gammaproteobacteria bacterium RIFCSPHIGHO2_12_FULL_45_9]
MQTPKNDVKRLEDNPTPTNPTTPESNTTAVRNCFSIMTQAIGRSLHNGCNGAYEGTCEGARKGAFIGDAIAGGPITGVTGCVMSGVAFTIGCLPLLFCNGGGLPHTSDGEDDACEDCICDILHAPAAIPAAAGAVTGALVGAPLCCFFRSIEGCVTDDAAVQDTTEANTQDVKNLKPQQRLTDKNDIPAGPYFTLRGYKAISECTQAMCNP